MYTHSTCSTTKIRHDRCDPTPWSILSDMFFPSRYHCTNNLIDLYRVHIIYFIVCIIVENNKLIYKVEAAVGTVGVGFGRISVYFFQITDFGSSDNLRYGCPHCGKRFKEPRYVGQHMVIHQEPHLECTLCGRRFRWLTSLRNHRIACRREGMHAEQASTMTRPMRDALERVQQARKTP